MKVKEFEFGTVRYDDIRGRLLCAKCGKQLAGDDIAVNLDGEWCCADCSGDKIGVRPILARTLEEIING